jgi:hypothetical protein
MPRVAFPLLPSVPVELPSEEIEMHKLVTTALATAILLSSVAVATPVQAQGFFRLPNFIGDRREEDSHYNTMHQYGFPGWDEYQLMLQSYSAEARAAGAYAWPNVPYGHYDYVRGAMTSGPGGPIPSAYGEVPTFVDGSSGISVNINGGHINGVQAATGGPAFASTNVQGTVLPSSFNNAPGLVPTP